MTTAIEHARVWRRVAVRMSEKARKDPGTEQDRVLLHVLSSLAQEVAKGYEASGQ